MTEKEIREELVDILAALELAEDMGDEVAYTDALLRVLDLKEDEGEEEVLSSFLDFIATKGSRGTIH